MFDYLLSQERGKILIVDDDPNIVQTLRDCLEMNDYLVVTAPNGREGLLKVSEEVPDIILLDVEMPIMDGYEMLEDMRKFGECRHVPIVMITGGDDKRTIAGIIACGGIDEYIVKPFDFGTLLKKIESIVESNHMVKL